MIDRCRSKARIQNDLRFHHSPPLRLTSKLPLVTDDYPAFIAADHNASVPGKIGIEYLAVDSSCIVSMSLHEKRAYAAYAIRPKIRRELPECLKAVSIPKLRRPWHDKLLPVFLPAGHTQVTLKDIAGLAAACEINHPVKPSPCFKGGYSEARSRLDTFLKTRLSRYSKESNQPSRHATSDLSP